MNRSFTLAALALATVLAALPAAAQALSPIGIWEPDNKESRYEFTYCGEAGNRLCAELIWIREDKKDARNTKYLNTYMFSNARLVAEGRWSGTVKIEGFNIGGDLTQTSPDTMRLKACALFIFCEDIRLNRVQ
ncbi:hypothetical protein [Pelagibacterium lacus]|uniref:DUF2147 domain-containing protein n=1 Tax=Pelagibacterium lacus TaxID=2282655 RepID=A0A369W4I0_9HYPH|nr:hypothetical protein [Pelagibacterium lacus]RDE08775.1 hypothetical protein DVH29_10075 [Pelagibacterium lacus]